eukprot:365344_1
MLWCSFLLVTIVAIVSSTDYYISSTTGSDSNAGTNQESPWETFENVPSLKLSGGDSLLLHAGDVWSESLVINDARGTDKSQIIISSYNTGNNTLPRPRINHYGNEGILCTNCEQIIFNNLALSNSIYGIVFTFSMKNTPFSNFNISNCYFNHINSPYYNATNGNWWGAAIVTGKSTQNGQISIYNFIMEHNMINGSDRFFFKGTYPVQIQSGRMYSNLLTNNYYNVMSLNGQMRNFNISNNVFLYDTPNQEFIYGTTDIIVGVVDSSCNIINNEFGERGEYPGGPDGCSIDFEEGAVGSSVLNNYIHDSYGAGVMVFGHRDTNIYNYNLTINNNIFIRDGCLQKKGDHGAIAFMNPSSGWVQNNIFVKCVNQNVPIFNDRSGNGSFTKDWVFTNNTIKNTTNGYVVDDPVVDIQINKETNIAVVTAKCGANNPLCTIRYTFDAGKPNINSMKYTIGQQLKYYVVTPVLFKSFQNGLVESATVGAIVDPFG